MYIQYLYFYRTQNSVLHKELNIVSNILQQNNIYIQFLFTRYLSYNLI